MIKEEKGYLFSGKALRRLIFPLLIEQFLSVAVGLADSIMVASVGEDAVSAVSLVDNISVLLIGLFAALATGGAVVAGQYIGQKDEEKACQAGEQMLVFVSVLAVVVMAVIYLGKNFILTTLFGQITPSVHNYANTYLLIVMASVPFLAMYNCGAALFRVQGNSQVSMKVSLLMNGINITGNAIFIYGLKWGVEGVAIPTLVSRIVSVVLIVVLLRNQKLGLHISKPFRYRFQRNMVRRILQIGIPNGVENSMFQLGKLVLLSLISTFGTTAIAANAVSNSIAVFKNLPGQAIGLALVTVVSQCVGARDYKQVRYYNRKLMKYTYLIMIGLNIIVLTCLPLILKVYHLSRETTELTIKILVLRGIAAMLIWPVSFTFPNTLRAANDAKYTMLISMLSMFFCRIILGFVFGKYLGLGVLGVWVAMILDWCVRSVFFTVRYYRGKWMEKSTLTG